MANAWTIEKKIPLTLVVVLIVQSVGVISWSAKLESSLTDHERRIVKSEAFIEQHSQSFTDLCQRLARLEEKLIAQTQYLDRIEKAIYNKREEK